MTRKLLSMLLALLVCLSAAAFAEEPEVYQFHKYEEPITLTTHAVVTTNNVFQEGDSAESNGMTRWYENELGIQWKMAWTSGDGESNSRRLPKDRRTSLFSSFLVLTINGSL